MTRARCREWVEGLAWDWCIFRQRYFGVPFPLWYCEGCGEVILADAAEPPVDPSETPPPRPCRCGSTDARPQIDMMETWATSSPSPQIVGGLFDDPDLYHRVLPFALRPQAHEIIRTWAFYTILQSLHHFGALPWREVAISGWGLAPSADTPPAPAADRAPAGPAAGAGAPGRVGGKPAKLSKSRGGGAMAPLAVIERYSADAVRYWAAGTGFGRDAVISEEKIAAGQKLVIKLWNVARFAAPFLGEGPSAGGAASPSLAERPGADDPLDQLAPPLVPTDRWILARLQRLVRRATELFDAYDYATARSEVEHFFWHDLADNYLEPVKKRLYAATRPPAARASGALGGVPADVEELGAVGDEAPPAAAQPGPPATTVGCASACRTLHRVLKTTLQLLAPVLPHVTEAIYAELFATPTVPSIHRSAWPQPDPALEEADAEAVGAALVEVAVVVRRYKSGRSLSLGAELARLQVATAAPDLAAALHEAAIDLQSVTRARSVEIVPEIDPGLESLPAASGLAIAVA